jgi:hypothetical protein
MDCCTIWLFGGMHLACRQSGRGDIETVQSLLGTGRIWLCNAMPGGDSGLPARAFANVLYVQHRASSGTFVIPESEARIKMGANMTRLLDRKNKGQE